MDKYTVTHYITTDWSDKPIVRVCIQDNEIEDEESARCFRIWNSVEVECPGFFDKLFKRTLEMKVNKAIKAQQKRADYMNYENIKKNKKLEYMHKKLNT